MAGERQAGTLATLVEKQRSWGVKVTPVSIDEASRRCAGLRPEGLAYAAFHTDGGSCDPAWALRRLFSDAQAAGVEFVFGASVTALSLKGQSCVGVVTSDGALSCGTTVLAVGAWANRLLLPLGVDLGLQPHLSRLAAFAPAEFETSEETPAILDRSTRWSACLFTHFAKPLNTTGPTMQ